MNNMVRNIYSVLLDKRIAKLLIFKKENPNYKQRESPLQPSYTMLWHNYEQYGKGSLISKDPFAFCEDPNVHRCWL